MKRGGDEHPFKLGVWRKVGAEAGFCVGVRDRRTVQARIAPILDQRLRSEHGNHPFSL